MRQGLAKIASSILLIMLVETKSPIDKCNIICEIVRRNKHSSSERDALKQEMTNKDAFWNDFLVSDFATAALHLLHWEEYNGDRTEINQLIKSKLVFE